MTDPSTTIATSAQPSAVDIEEAVLGACMLEEKAYGIVAGIIGPEAFYNANHARIFYAIKSCHERKVAPDILTVTEELKRRGDLVIVGGAYYVSQLTNRVATSHNIESHARIIAQQYIKRKIIEISSASMHRGYDPHTDVFDALDGLAKEVKSLYSYIGSGSVVSSDAIFDKVIETAKTAGENDGISGYPSGFRTLDLYLNGLKPGRKYTFAARPSMGKTTIVKNICKHLALNLSLPGVFFSMEMSAEELMSTIIAELTGIDATRIEKWALTDAERIIVEGVKTKYPLNNFIIDPTPALSPDYIEGQVKRWKEERNIGWFAYDYLQLCRIRGMEKNNEQMLASITSATKTIAKQTNTICFEISQLSREVEKRSPQRPILSDCRGSGSIEQDADAIIFLYRPEYYGYTTAYGMDAKGLCFVLIAKNRFGGLKNFAMDFLPKVNMFKDREKYDFNESNDSQQSSNSPIF